MTRALSSRREKRRSTSGLSVACTRSVVVDDGTFRRETRSESLRGVLRTNGRSEQLRAPENVGPRPPQNIRAPQNIGAQEDRYRRPGVVLPQTICGRIPRAPDDAVVVDLSAPQDIAAIAAAGVPRGAVAGGLRAPQNVVAAQAEDAAVPRGWCPRECWCPRGCWYPRGCWSPTGCWCPRGCCSPTRPD